MNAIKVHFLEGVQAGVQSTFETLAHAELAIANNLGLPLEQLTFERSGVAAHCRIVRSRARINQREGHAVALLLGMPDADSERLSQPVAVDRFVIHTGILVQTGSSAGSKIVRESLGEAMEYISQVWGRPSDTFFIQPCFQQTTDLGKYFSVWTDAAAHRAGKLPIATIARK